MHKISNDDNNNKKKDKTSRQMQLFEKKISDL